MVKLAGLWLLLLFLVISANNSAARKVIRYSLVVKVISLVSIIAGGIYYIATHSSETPRLANAFEGM